MLQSTANRPVRRAEGSPDLLYLDGLGLTVAIHDRLEQLAPLWDEIGGAASPSIFQSHAWLGAWCRTAAPAQGERPLVAAVRGGSGELKLLLPLGLKRRLGTTVAEFLGQSHANYNVALMESSFQGGAQPQEIGAILRALGQAGGISAFHFDKQPVVWNGMPNPFAAWLATPCPNDSYVLPLEADFESLSGRLFSKRTRSMLRRKARKLSAGGEVVIGDIQADADRRRLLEAFFIYKGEQLAAQGAGNVFASPGVADFYTRLVGLPRTTDGHVEVRAITVGGRAVAIALVAAFAGRHYLLNMALAPDAPRDCSPGAVLLHDDIEHACITGRMAYDFGPGAAAYKAAWQPETLPLTTSIGAVSPAGLPAAGVLAAASLAKRTVKRSPRLWDVAQRVRRVLRGHTSDTPAD